jgi:hypothetical protein
MNEEMQKALEQIRKAAANLGAEGMEATLTAMRLQAISFTALYVLSIILYVVSIVVCIRLHTGTGHSENDMIGPAIISTVLFLVFTMVFFLSSAWMGIVSPEAALAQEVIDKF